MLETITIIADTIGKQRIIAAAIAAEAKSTKRSAKLIRIFHPRCNVALIAVEVQQHIIQVAD